VLRHGSGNLLYWSHHDKIVCVDQEVAFVGGLDLTEGASRLLHLFRLFLDWLISR